MQQTHLPFFAALLGLLLLTLPARTAPLAHAELVLWSKADDLHLADGALVTHWPDSSGQHNDLTAKDGQAPSFLAKGSFGRPVIAFRGDVKANPKVIQAFQAPFSGEWRGCTIFLVGTNLSDNTWLNTSQSVGDFRTLGFIQLTGTQCAIEHLPAPANPADVHIVALTCGIDDTGACTLTSYMDGTAQGHMTDPKPGYGIIFGGCTLGAAMDICAYHGEMAEVLMYKGLLTDDERVATQHYLEVKYGKAPATPTDIGRPAGFPPPQPPVEKPATTTLQPCQRSLMLLACADTITTPDYAPVDTWANLVNPKFPLLGVKDHQPMLVKHALAGHAVVRFQGTWNNTVLNYMDVQIEGVTPELTMFFVGRHLERYGLFDTAPGLVDTLRHIQAIQNCASRQLALEHPFPILGNEDPQLVSLVVGKEGETGQYIASYAYGYPQARNVSQTEIKPIRFKQATLGVINRTLQPFNGDIAEVLIYGSALTNAERQQTERYLTAKYGLPLKSLVQRASEPAPRSAFGVKYPQLPRTMSWLGNTESGKTNHIQHGICGICVQPDGTVAATSIYDEAHKDFGLYKDGKSLGGIGGGFSTVITDGKYYYLGVSGVGKKHAGVRRLSLDLQDAPWPGAEQGQIGFDTPAPWNEIEGLAIVNRDLYLTCDAVDAVGIYDPDTGKLKGHFPVKTPGRMAVDPDGKLWIGTPDGLVQYTAAGTETGQFINGIKVGGVTLDKQGHLLVVDAGTRLQIITYDITGARPKEIAALGERSGVFAGPRPGAMSDLRLLNPNGVGVDAAGNIYVSGGWRLLSFTPEGKPRWHVEATMFATCGDFDPDTDGQDLYTKDFHFTATTDQTPGKDWRWTGYLADPVKYPDGVTTEQALIMRRLNGTLYRFALAWQIKISRQLPNSELFIPCAAVNPNEAMGGPVITNAPAKGRFIWIDKNSNGLPDKDEFTTPPADTAPSQWGVNCYVDTNGGIWEAQGRAGVRYIPLQGFTATGAPIYDFVKVQSFLRPPEFLDVRRAMYFPALDSMYLSGYTWDNQAWPDEQWVNSGRELIRYDDWTKPTRHLVSRIPFIARDITSFDVLPSRHLAFLGEMTTSSILVYNADTGKMIGVVEPDPNLVGYETGWLDLPEGALRVCERKNGEVLILTEECYKAKQLLYRCPPDFEHYQPLP